MHQTHQVKGSDMPGFLAGITVGLIIMQTMVLAPTLFRTLEMGPAGTLLRALFPKFFLLLAALGLITLVYRHQH